MKVHQVSRGLSFSFFLEAYLLFYKKNQLRPFLNSTKLLWLNSKRWDSRLFVVKRHCWQQAIKILKRPWNGYSDIWKILVRYWPFCLRFIIIKKTWIHVDIDSPIQVASAIGPTNNGPEPSPEQIAMLSDMGFTSAQARKALRETVRKFFLGIFKNLVTMMIISPIRIVRERRTCRGVAI